MVFIKGHEIVPPNIKDSFDRRALQLENSIISNLNLIGVKRHSIKVNMQKMAQRKLLASVTWYFNGHNLQYRYSLMSKYVENLYIIDKILKLEVSRLLSKEILLDDFIREFSEDEEIEEKLREARETLCLKTDEIDMGAIDKNYKLLAKKYHPDMPDGDLESFQRINAAHKLLKKELT